MMIVSFSTWFCYVCSC